MTLRTAIAASALLTAGMATAQPAPPRATAARHWDFGASRVLLVR